MALGLVSRLGSTVDTMDDDFDDDAAFTSVSDFGTININAIRFSGTLYRAGVLNEIAAITSALAKNDVRASTVWENVGQLIASVIVGIFMFGVAWDSSNQAAILGSLFIFSTCSTFTILPTIAKFYNQQAFFSTLVGNGHASFISVLCSIVIYELSFLKVIVPIVGPLITWAFLSYRDEIPLLTLVQVSMVFSFLINLIGMTIATYCYDSRDVTGLNSAVVLAAQVVGLFSSAAGVLIPFGQIPWFFQCFYYISPTSHFVAILGYTLFDENNIPCAPNEDPSTAVFGGESMLVISSPLRASTPFLTPSMSLLLRLASLVTDFAASFSGEKDSTSVNPILPNCPVDGTTIMTSASLDIIPLEAHWHFLLYSVLVVIVFFILNLKWRVTELPKSNKVYIAFPFNVGVKAYRAISSKLEGKKKVGKLKMAASRALERGSGKLTPPHPKVHHYNQHRNGVWVSPNDFYTFWRTFLTVACTLYLFVAVTVMMHPTVPEVITPEPYKWCPECWTAMGNAPMENLPGVFQCKNVPVDISIEYYTVVVRPIAARQLAGRQKLPMLDPPIVDQRLETIKVNGVPMRRTLTFEEYKSFYAAGVYTKEEEEDRYQRFWSNTGDGAAIMELFSLHHAHGLLRLSALPGPSDFPVDDSDVRLSLANITSETLEECLAAGKLFMWNMTLFEVMNQAQVNFEGYVYNQSSPYALFYQGSNDFYTLAIQLGSKPETSPLFTPREPNRNDWLYARMRLRQSAYLLQGQNHVLGMHFMSSTLFAASYHAFGNNKGHYFGELMRSMTNRGSVAACSSGPAQTKTVGRAPGQVLGLEALPTDYTFGVDLPWYPSNFHLGVPKQKVILDALGVKYPPLKENRYPDFLAKRNLEDVDNVLPHEILTRKSLLKIWYVIDGFLKDFMAAIWETEEAFMRDAAIHSFYNELRDPTMGNHHYLPEKLTSRDQLCDEVMTPNFFMNFLHGLTRNEQVTMKVFQHKLTLPSALKNLPTHNGKPNISSPEDLLDMLPDSQDVLNDLAVSSFALAFPSQNLWQKQGTYGKDLFGGEDSDANHVFKIFLEDLFMVMADSPDLVSFITALEAAPEV